MGIIYMLRFYSPLGDHVSRSQFQSVRARACLAYLESIVHPLASQVRRGEWGPVSKLVVRGQPKKAGGAESQGKGASVAHGLGRYPRNQLYWGLQHLSRGVIVVVSMVTGVALWPILGVSKDQVIACEDSLRLTDSDLQVVSDREGLFDMTS